MATPGSAPRIPAARLAVLAALLLGACDASHQVPLRTEPLANLAPSLAPPPPAQVLSDHGVGLAGRARGPLASLVAAQAAGILANNAAGLIGNHAAGLIANNAGNVVANNGGNVIANNGAGYGLLYAESDLAPLDGARVSLEGIDRIVLQGAVTTADAGGRFTLATNVVPSAPFLAVANGAVAGQPISLLALADPGSATLDLDPATSLVAKKIRAAGATGVTPAQAAALARAFAPAMSTAAAVAAVVLPPDAAGRAFDAMVAELPALRTAAQAAGLAQAPPPAPSPAPAATPTPSGSAGGGSGGGGSAPAPTPTPTPEPPSVAAISPTSGSPGMKLTITGQGFAPTAAGNQVVIGGVTATVQQASATRLVAVVPPQAGNGVVTVTVNGQTAAGAQGFTAIASGTLIGSYAVGNHPSHIAFDAAGNAWVTNYGTSTVSKLSSAGAPLATIPVPASPEGIAIDARDVVWVTSDATGKVTQLDTTGATLATTQVEPNRALGIAIDAAGTAWVSAAGTAKLARISPAGVLLGTTNVGVTPYGVAIDPNGNAWVANYGSGTVSRVDPAGNALGTSPTGVQTNSIAFDAAGDAWVANGTAGTVTHLAPDGSVRGTTTTGADPFGIAVAADGSIWVSLYSTHTLAKLDPAGTVIATYPGNTNPYGLVFDARGCLWVANYGAGSVRVIAP